MEEKKLSAEQREELLRKVKDRFKKNANRHPEIEWEKVETKLDSDHTKLWSLFKMEETGGEPDVVEFDPNHGVYIFYDCSPESPKGRRSLCYDREAWQARKKFKPENTATDLAYDMGIELLTESQYRLLQKLGEFDKKTSSWIQTPSSVRKLGGALFCDYRYGQCFVYHNGADSYYGSRGFRGSLRV